MPAKRTPSARSRRAGQGRRDIEPSKAPTRQTLAAIKGKEAPTDRRTARESQFLDVAAQLIRERGIGGVTMERLAEAAGVSKALPYRYFDNADAVFIALHEREIGALSQRIGKAIAERGPKDSLMAVAIHEYFEVVAERGDLLSSLAGAGSPIPALVESQADSPNLLADLFTTVYRIKGKRAVALAAIVTGALVAASDSVGRGEVSRATAERVAIVALSAAAKAVAAE